MYILAIETSTQLGSVCVLENDRVIAEKESHHQKSHSDFVHQAIESILSESSLKLDQIDLFAAGIGPGSFTGIRIAVNVAKTFSYLFKKPIVAVDSLTLLANQVVENQLPVLSMINAYKNMIYTSVYQWNDGSWTQLRATDAVPVQGLDEWLAQDPVTKNLTSYNVVGDGFSTYKDHFQKQLIPKLRRAPQTLDYPLGKTLGKLALTQYQSGQTLDWKSLQPLYIRASEAEETKRGLIFSPLK